MRIQIDPSEVARYVKASGIDNPLVLLIDEGWFYFYIDARGTAASPSPSGSESKVHPKTSKESVVIPPTGLEFINPDWTEEAKAALEWLWNYKKRTGKAASFPKLAKRIGMDVRQVRKYFKESPPIPNQDTINAILKFKAEADL